MAEKMSQKAYDTRVKKQSPPTPRLKNTVMAFLVGGLVCALGQEIIELCTMGGMEPEQARLTASLSLMTLAALLTALGIYDKIARHAGGGTLVPITGFANAMVAPAMEFRREGLVLGVGAKMFSVAGPVIVYGVLAAWVYGLIRWVVVACGG